MLLLDIQEERIQGSFAVAGPSPLPQGVFDPQGVGHVKLLDQILGSRLVHCLQKLLPVLPCVLHNGHCTVQQSLAALWHSSIQCQDGLSQPTLQQHWLQQTRQDMVEPPL